MRPKADTTSRAARVVLIYLSGALGDCVLSTPALAALRAAFPDAHLHGLVPPALPLLYPHLFNSWTAIDRAAVAELFSADAGRALAAQAAWRAADTAVIFEPPGAVLARRLRATGRMRVVCVDATPARCVNESYAVWLWRRTAEALGGAPAFSVPVPAGVAPPQPPAPPFAVVHPGSGSAAKNCPAERLATACLNAARARQQPRAAAGAPQPWHWIMIATESDRRAVDAFIRAWRAPLELVLNAPLPHVVWYLRQAAYYVGNDSGISHLAGAAGVRGIVFFGPTNPRVWRPLGSTIAVEIFTAASRRIKAAPARRRD